MTDSDIIAAIIKREGGEKYTNNPADRGGPTKYGITLATLTRWRGYTCNAGDVEALTEAEAYKIYRKVYLEDTGISRIQSVELRAQVLDAAVNHPAVQAIRMLQRALGVPDDGVIGPTTLAAIPYLDPRRICVRFLAQRIRFYGRIVTRNMTDADKDGMPDNAEMDEGWMNRVGELLESVA